MTHGDRLAQRAGPAVAARMGQLKLGSPISSQVDPSTIVDRDLAAVTGKQRVRDYQMDLSETVPYIGAKLVQDLGVDGSGVKVAILDSGVDYTHAALGGGGTLADYEAAWGTCHF